MKLRHLEATNLKALQDALEKIEGSCILHSIIPKGNSWYAFLLMQDVGRDPMKIEKIVKTPKTKKLGVSHE